VTHLGWSDSLTVAESGRVRAVLAAAHAADGVGPVSDDVALAVRPGAAPAAGRGHLLAAGPADDISGYAHLAPASVTTPAVANGPSPPPLWRPGP